MNFVSDTYQLLAAFAFVTNIQQYIDNNCQQYNIASVQIDLYIMQLKKINK